MKKKGEIGVGFGLAQESSRAWFGASLLSTARIASRPPTLRLQSGSTTDKEVCIKRCA